MSNTQVTVPAVPCGPVNFSMTKLIAAAALVHARAPPSTAKMLSPRSTTHFILISSKLHEAISRFSHRTSFSQSDCFPKPSTPTPYFVKHCMDESWYVVVYDVVSDVVTVDDTVVVVVSDVVAVVLVVSDVVPVVLLEVVCVDVTDEVAVLVGDTVIVDVAVELSVVVGVVAWQSRNPPATQASLIAFIVVAPA